MRKKNFGLHIDIEILIELRKESNITNVSVSAIISRELRKYLNKKVSKNKTISIDDFIKNDFGEYLEKHTI